MERFRPEVEERDAWRAIAEAQESLLGVMMTDNGHARPGDDHGAVIVRDARDVIKSAKLRLAMIAHGVGDEDMHSDISRNPELNR